MTKTIEIKRLRDSSIFKIVVFGSATGCAAISTIFGVFALFGVDAIQWNGESLTGIKGFLVSPFIGLFAGSFFGLFTSVFVYIGSRIYSLLGGEMVVEYIPSNESQVS